MLGTRNLYLDHGATQITVPSPMETRFASSEAVLVISKTVTSTSSKFTYPALGKAVSDTGMVVVVKISGLGNL